MLCETCRLDTVPWPKRRYCSLPCRRRAAYLRRRGRVSPPRRLPASAPAADRVGPVGPVGPVGEPRGSYAARISRSTVPRFTRRFPSNILSSPSNAIFTR